MIWDKLASKYDKLWLQKYSLTPTRDKIHTLIEEIINTNNKNPIYILDMGCGTGQLVIELYEKYQNNVFIVGVDKSQEMLNIATNKINADNVIFKQMHMSIDNTDLITLLPDNVDKFDIICCCHSFPYYEDKPRVLKDIRDILADTGTALLFQGSINSLYDKFAMAIIELTAEKADYLSKKDFTTLASDYFNVTDTFTIREIFYAPTIGGFRLIHKKD